MKSTEFCYWLQGYFELVTANEGKKVVLSKEQVNVIQNHLNMVFKHEIDPSYPDSKELSNLHNPKNDVIVRC